MGSFYLIYITHAIKSLLNRRQSISQEYCQFCLLSKIRGCDVFRTLPTQCRLLKNIFPAFLPQSVSINLPISNGHKLIDILTSTNTKLLVLNIYIYVCFYQGRFIYTSSIAFNTFLERSFSSVNTKNYVTFNGQLNRLKSSFLVFNKASRVPSCFRATSPMD